MNVLKDKKATFPYLSELGQRALTSIASRNVFKYEKQMFAAPHTGCRLNLGRFASLIKVKKLN